MKKVGLKELKDAYAKFNGNTDEMAKALGLSYSNVRYRIRKLEAVDVSPDVVNKYAVNADDKKADTIVGILETKIDQAKYVPMVDPNYFKRTVDSTMEKIGLKLKKNLFLIGEAGSGKTYGSEQLAARAKLPFLRVALDDSLILKELLGKRDIINGTTYFKEGILLSMVQIPSVILFDEVNANGNGKFFLHELLDHRRLFIKDAEGGKTIMLHQDCIILLAANPNTARYCGTSKLNAALVDRTTVVPVPCFTPEEIPQLFDTGKPAVTESLKKFYVDCQRIIRDQDLRVVFSLRGVQRIVEFIKAGETIAQALGMGFYNSAIVTASIKEKNTLENLAKVHFGVENFPETEVKKEEVNQ